MLQKELAKRLKARYDTKMDGNEWLEVSSDGIPLCRIKYNGQFLSNADQNLSDEYRSKIADIQDEISTVREYVGLYEHAPQMKAADVSDYRQLAAFGDTVLAATYSEKNGFMFCTWKQNADGDSVFWGDYSPNYEYVKEAFAVRSGLVSKDRLFSENESAYLCRCVDFTKGNCETLTYEQERQLDIKGDPVERAIWLNLPMASDILANYAAAFNEADIGDCVYYDFESVIPQITSEMFGSMSDVQTLNKLAAEISIMSEAEQVKFRAVLDAENTATVKDALNAAQNLWRYEFTAEPDTADAFFKKYIFENTSTEFDSRWLENLLPRNEADKLLGRIGAAVTDYGVISARNGHLFEPVPYDEPEAKELKTQALTEEKLDVIEVLDRRALFSNGRLMPEEIPEGLYAYDLRHSDDGGRFCAIEPKVGVNHGGTLLMRDILDFGESGYIPLDEDTEPNFLGETMTVSEFAEEEAQDETMQMGGMQL